MFNNLHFTHKHFKVLASLVPWLWLVVKCFTKMSEKMRPLGSKSGSWPLPEKGGDGKPREFLSDGFHVFSDRRASRVCLRAGEESGKSEERTK